MIHSQSSTIRRHWLAFTLVFLIALAVRLAFISSFARAPEGDHLWNDAVGWNLAHGRGFTASPGDPSIPGIFRTPGYPLLLALVYALFGHSYTAVFLFQAVLDALAAVVLGLIGYHLFSLRVALVASALYACYPYSAIYCGSLHQDILLTFTLQIVLLLVIQACRRPNRPWLWLAAGIGFGFVALIKAYLLLYAVIPALTIAFQRSPARVKAQALALFVLGTGLLLAPWLARNYLVFGRFPLMAVGTNGTDLMLLVEELDTNEDALFHRHYSSQNLSPTGGEVSPQQYMESFVDGTTLMAVEAKQMEVATSALLRRWPKYVLVAIQHIPRLWLTRHAAGQPPWVAVVGEVVSWGFLLPGIWGLFLLRHRWRSLFSLYATILWMTLIYAPCLAEARYTLPARPALLLFVAATLAFVWQKLASGERRSVEIEAAPPSRRLTPAPVRYTLRAGEMDDG